MRWTANYEGPSIVAVCASVPRWRTPGAATSSSVRGTVQDTSVIPVSLRPA